MACLELVFCDVVVGAEARGTFELRGETMDKVFILDEIKRTAKENGGKPLGLNRFFKATGIREADWRGKYWENFGDAQEEAGFPRNTKQEAFDDVLLIEKLISAHSHRLGNRKLDRIQGFTGAEVYRKS